MIAIIIKIQRIYRMRRQKREEERQAEADRTRMLEKRAVIKGEEMAQIKRQRMKEGE